MGQSILKEEGVVVFVDHRELRSGIAKWLYRKKVNIKPIHLTVADFQISERVGVERKNTKDFLQSLTDGRLFEQAKRLKGSFERPLLLVVGEDDVFSLSGIHPNAIRGAILSLLVDCGVPILWVKNDEEAADFLYLLARREQLDLKKSVQIRSNKKAMGEKEEMVFLVSGLPGIGTELAKKLLKKFGCAEMVFRAGEEALKEVEKIGPIKAKRIRKVLTKRYE